MDRSVICHSEVRELLIKYAKENNIPYQLEIMSSSTGTNADVIAVSAKGKKTALLSFPLKNMHTMSEIVNMNDAFNTSRLIAEVIKSL